MRTKVVRLQILVLAAYTGTYAIAYACRQPAANLAYFAYTEAPISESLEKGLWCFYWPVYKTHKFLGAQRHTYDRDPTVDYPGA